MAPKTIPPLAKQSLILSYLHTSQTVHTLKDLEKTLPAVASINGMQVKEYLQALSDEGKIRVEKIGSGNWYWAFLSEEKKARDVTLEKLREEKTKVEAVVQELREKVEEASDKREEGEDDSHTRGERGREQARLVEEVARLRMELNQYKDGDPRELDRTKEEIKIGREKAERWTDNLIILEQWLAQMLAGDREKMKTILSMYYGDEYVEGEGLREL